MIRITHTKEGAIRRFPFFFLITAAGLLAGCEANPPGGQIVARVNSTVLTKEMILDQMDTTRTLTDDEIRQYVNRWVTGELLYQEALQRGFDETEMIQRKVEEARKQLSIAEMLEKEVYASAERSVNSEDIAAYFQTHGDEYLLKEDLIRLSLIIFTTNEAATQFRASALGETGWNESVNRVRSNNMSGVVSYSDSLFFTQSSLYPPELWKVAGILGMFEVSFPVNTSVGFVVMRSLGQHKKGSLTPIQYVSGDIRHRLTMERRQKRYQEFLQQIRGKHTVQYIYSASDSTGIGD